MDMTDEYPYLTAWIGFVALMSVGTLLLGFVLSIFTSSPYVIFLVFYLFVGFYVFRELVIKQILGSTDTEELILNHRTSNLSSRYPFLTAWIGFLVIGLIPNVLISNLIYIFPGQILSFLVGYIIFLVVDFFVFRFVVRRNVVGLLMTNQGRN